MKLPKVLLIVLIFGLIGASGDGGCVSHSGDTSEATKKQEEATEKMHDEAWRQVGMPALDNFQEMKLMKRIIELRDEQLLTHTYTVDRDGQLHYLCPSMGYGLPYSTQMTNPKN